MADTRPAAPRPPRPRRGLFWRVYLTLLLALALTTFVGAGLWRHLSEGPARGIIIAQGEALGVLLPPRDAPPAATAEAVRRLSLSFHRSVILAGPDCRPIAAARQGVLQQLGDDARGLCLESTRFQFMTHSLRTDLKDGRILIIRTSPAFAGRHMHGLMILMLVAAVVALAAYPVVGGITRRLERLKGSLDAWGRGQADARADVDGDDEIAAVAAAFNAAADRNEALLAAHKALLAHASHELRSPLARLRMASELYGQRPEPALKAQIAADIAELDGLVDEILLASRLDHAPGLDATEPVDLLALAAEEASRAGVEVAPVAEGAGPFEVAGSPRLLRRLIRNLIENALKHGAPPVEVAVGRLGEAVTIAVTDHGPGIPPALREQVFEPFYRPQGASEATGSWGLGLALVRQIAERHGGQVRCEAGPGGVGGRFVAAIPTTH